VDHRDHWENLYARSTPRALSWHQGLPSASITLIERAGISADARIVDVGGGESGLAAALLDRGHRDVTVVDIAGWALDAARRRLGARAPSVRLVRADVMQDALGGPYDLWHDRALFHFFTSADAQARYRERLLAELGPGGRAVIATFAPDGPAQCSGLPVARYSAEELAAVFAPGLEPIESLDVEHETPAGRRQPFVYVLLGRRP
jgi:hypothetical protein